VQLEQQEEAPRRPEDALRVEAAEWHKAFGPCALSSGVASTTGSGLCRAKDTSRAAGGRGASRGVRPARRPNSPSGTPAHCVVQLGPAPQGPANTHSTALPQRPSKTVLWPRRAAVCAPPPRPQGSDLEDVAELQVLRVGAPPVKDVVLVCAGVVMEGPKSVSD
jgi:hypothetical protein